MCKKSSMIEQGAMIRITWISLTAIPLEFALVLVMVLLKLTIPRFVAIPVFMVVLIIPRYWAIKRYATLVDYTHKPVI